MKNSSDPNNVKWVVSVVLAALEKTGLANDDNAIDVLDALTFLTASYSVASNRNLNAVVTYLKRYHARIKAVP